jgi:predicted transcriptional regulator YdeE
MLAYMVSRSIEIEKSQKEIIDYLKDFRNWPAWSPWVILEPGCELNYLGEQGHVGAAYEWEGKRIGAGTVVLESTQEHRLDMELHFFRPMKSHGKVTFIVTPSQRGCLVEWQMHSSVPWYSFFAKSLSKSIIEMDFDRGLRMLKSQLETGQVLSQLVEIANRKQPTIQYMGISGAGTIHQLGSILSEHMERLRELVANENLPVNGDLFCYYQSLDVNTGQFEFITCLPLEREVAVPEGFVSGSIHECDTFVVEHRGEYQMLGNAWALAMNLTRHAGIKVKSTPIGIERYLNNSEQSEPAEWRTEVILFEK